MAAWPLKLLSDETTFHLDDKATITTLAYTVVKNHHQIIEYEESTSDMKVCCDFHSKRKVMVLSINISPDFLTIFCCLSIGVKGFL
jgi:hypothetical protein